VLELMIVLVILSLIGVVAGTQVLQQLDRARVDVARLQLQQVRNALTLFELDARRYPTAEEGLDVLIAGPGELEGWRGPYLKSRELLADPWGGAINYERTEGHFRLTSLGADRQVGGEGAAADILLADND
jgi:general secretion pathway protein G